ncbi:TonB-dependent receptor [Sphingobium sp. CAP-1]|uniref:TonB-dependent receptor n=1 Tax=Sphingobium sp. CAP-1 TaxID=2676077 RepID=UPI0012BB4041|nr:TonB-dependent receptor [Sphingobium sp. CAP-1]QGP81184.1 TonB-dependent receptor [Sphingobium sp. CAP-1]
MRTAFSSFLMSTAAAALACAAQNAAAQSAAAPQASADTSAPNELGEIVVTANRVASSAQKTATALTVYSGNDLAAAGVASVQSLQTIDPSVNVTSSTGAAYVAVRGIASTDVTEIGDPSVPIARDGFFTNRSFSIGTSMYDLERVEVLKGPQGTLFGRNSTGGLVSIITQKPKKELGAFGSIEVGNYDTINVEAGANLPVGDKVQFRFSGITRRHDGYRDITVINAEGDDEKTVSGRAQVAFQPFEGFSGLISYQHDEIDAVGDLALQSAISTVPTITDEKRFPNYQPTFTRLNGDRIRWEFSYDALPLGLTLTYAGGYDNQKWGHALDASNLGGTTRQQFLQSESPETWNHEVRIATPQDGPFTLQAGYFHFDEKNTIDSGLLVRSGPYADRYLIKFDYAVKTQSDAVFGHATYKFGDALKASAGIRYTWDKKDREGNAVLDLEVASGGHAPAILITTPGNGSISQHKPTYHVGLDWTPTNQNMVYVKYDTGYKSGGFNSNGSAASVDYAPENLDAFELGTKNRFLNNQLQVNAAAFYQKYKGYQASQTTAVISSGSGTFNIGSATIYGVEAQVVALLGGLRMDLNGTWLHANFSDSVGSVRDGAGVVRDISGNRLPNAPRLSLTGGLEYSFPIGDGTLKPRIDGKYSSAYYYSVFNDADTRQGNYATGNISLTWVPRVDGPLELQLFVRNFTDEAVYANAARNFVAGVNTYQFQAPRTYGGRLAFHF